MVNSHAVHMSRSHSSETEEQSLPLATQNPQGRSSNAQVPHRDSLTRRVSVFSGPNSTRVQLNAIAQLGEDRRRASIAIRRQSILQSQQDSADDNVPLQPRGHRESIGAYRRQSVAAARRQGVQDRRGSTASRKQSILDDRRGSIAERRGSVADRRSSLAPVQRSHRRSSVIDIVTQSTTQAVRRASLAMCAADLPALIADVDRVDVLRSRRWVPVAACFKKQNSQPRLLASSNVVPLQTRSFRVQVFAEGP
jgi:hypothetical protein